jgi:hypothetical protein
MVTCVQNHDFQAFLLEERHLGLDQRSSIARQIDNWPFAGWFIKPDPKRRAALQHERISLLAVSDSFGYLSSKMVDKY